MVKEREIKEEHVFKVEGTFESLYAAQSWLHSNGFSYGSLCRDMPVAIIDGPYDLPQKYKNFDEEDKDLVDGWMTSNDFREGEVKVIIYK